MKIKLQLIIKFILFSLLFFLLSMAGINGLIYPFAFAMLFALAWANQKVWLIVPAYLAGAIGANYSFEGIISALVTAIVLAASYYIHVSLKKPMCKWELLALTLLSQTANVVFKVISGDIFSAVITPIAGLCYLCLLLMVFEPLLMRGISYKLTLPEIVSGGVVLVSIAIGLGACNIYGFSLLKLFVALSLLIISNVTSPGRTIIFASLMALGSLLENNNPIYFAPFIIWALAVISFKFLNRYISAVAIILAEVIITFYFDLYYSFSWVGISSVIAAVLIFCILPQKLFKSLHVLLSPAANKSAVKCMLNRNREILERRLNNLGEVFYDMNVVFRKLIKKEASEEEVKDMLFEEIKSSICKGCTEQKHCHRTFSEDTRELFKNLITIALERGKITLLDLPTYLSSRCSRSGQLISDINTLTSQYKSYSALVGNVDNSKLLISEQLEGVSYLMKTLANEVDTMISMDTAREKKLQDELSSNNIICTDALVYERDARTMMATLVVREEDVNKLKLQAVASKVCGNQMAIYDVYPTEKAGLMAVNLKTAPRYDCIFGLASTPKSGGVSSGDRHTIERLDGDKFLFAICDGMGSGEKAGEKAETAIGLIENFYKAGFASDTILSSVNRLMNLEKEDIFSSIDICIVDLKDGVGDFIKMGASSSYIRGEDGCKIIECSSLPVGILDNAKAVTKKVVFNGKDFVVLCSDGINDSFGKDSEFKDFLLTIKTANPQEYADQILQKALSINSGYAVDDMTVIVIKIF